ncbi:MAG: zinc-ribbon domain-containing protein, partial [Gammaproteobacteria bacterium]|nr:zinc-ribbon domain-containing protein [Gammaproteobacteria bacterium]
MYTRCPNCSTIFRVSASQLRVALGEVSCGSCHETFNALNALTDDLPELTEVVVLDPVESPSESEPRAAPAPPAPAAEDRAEPVTHAGEELVESGPAEVSSPQVDDGEQQPDDPGAAWADPGDEADIGVETDVNDELVDTFVDEATDAEPPEDADDNESAHDAAGFRDGEPCYDDHTGVEEVLTGFDEEGGEVPPEEPAEGEADAWAGILAEVHEDDLADDRRELEIEARASRDLADDSAGVLEPAYDDHTGIEEILHEGEFSDGEDEDGNEAASEAERDDLEFDAPEQAWSEIFTPTDSRQPPYIPPEAGDTESEQEQSSEESLDFSSLSALESETADPDEWANLLTELAPDNKDEQPEQPEQRIPEAEQGYEIAEPAAFDCDESDATEIILSSSEALPIVSEPASFADSLNSEDSTSGDDDKPANPLIDYATEFVPPWESEPPEQSGDATASILKLPKRTIAIAALLVVALGIQLVHYNRDSLARHPSWGARIQGLYSALGSELYPDWQLDSYRITGSEAVAGRTDKSALDIIANVMIGGDEAVGL